MSICYSCLHYGNRCWGRGIISEGYPPCEDFIKKKEGGDVGLTWDWEEKKWI